MKLSHAPVTITPKAESINASTEASTHFPFIEWAKSDGSITIIGTRYIKPLICGTFCIVLSEYITESKS